MPIDADVWAHYRAQIGRFGAASAPLLRDCASVGVMLAGVPGQPWCAGSDAGIGLTGHLAACGAARARRLAGLCHVTLPGRPINAEAFSTAKKPPGVWRAITGWSVSTYNVGYVRV